MRGRFWVCRGLTYSLTASRFWLMGAASHASLAYSEKNPPLAVLAAAKKIGLQLHSSELKDAKKDAPPVFSMADGCVIWPTSNLSGMSCQLTTLAKKPETSNTYSIVFASASANPELICFSVGRAGRSYQACLPFCST